jgi:precorrin-3B C17-methyltransferase
LPLENKLFVVGIGPGALDQMTCRAVEAIEGSKFVVGHRTYIDMIGDLTKGKQIISSNMGREVERAKIAVEMLDKGPVSLISGGDPNVYAMAGLGLEMASKGGSLESVEVVPGVTSFAAGACRAGITFRETVAVISLSDLLTPWSEIEHRVQLAASSLMPVAIYNPKSRRRNWQLDRVLKIYQELGRADTEVLIAKNVMRSCEKLQWTTIGELVKCADLIDEIDMFTLLIIGGRGMTRGGNLSDSSSINIIGVGPGDPRHLTNEALGLLKRSQKIFGAERYLDTVRNIASGDLISHNGPFNERMKKSYLAAKNCSNTSILVGGDPSVFSSAWRILDESIRCDPGVHISAGVSAFSAVAARIGAPLVSDFVLLSGLKNGNFERPAGSAVSAGYDMISDLMSAGFAIVVYNTNASELPELMEAISSFDRPCALAQDVSRSDESLIVSRTSELETLIRGHNGMRSTLIVAGPKSYIKNDKIITQRGYESKYSY